MPVPAAILHPDDARFRFPPPAEKRHDSAVMAMHDVPVPANVGTNADDRLFLKLRVLAFGFRSHAALDLPMSRTQCRV